MNKKIRYLLPEAQILPFNKIAHNKISKGNWDKMLSESGLLKISNAYRKVNSTDPYRKRSTEFLYKIIICPSDFRIHGILPSAVVLPKEQLVGKASGDEEGRATNGGDNPVTYIFVATLHAGVWMLLASMV